MLVLQSMFVSSVKLFMVLSRLHVLGLISFGQQSFKLDFVKVILIVPYFLDRH